jgi:hypothetical protein
MAIPADQPWSQTEADWSDALVLLALGQAIAESQADVLREPVPAALDDLLRLLTEKAGEDDGKR